MVLRLKWLFSLVRLFRSQFLHNTPHHLFLLWKVSQDVLCQHSCYCRSLISGTHLSIILHFPSWLPLLCSLLIGCHPVSHGVHAHLSTHKHHISLSLGLGPCAFILIHFFLEFTRNNSFSKKWTSHKSEKNVSPSAGEKWYLFCVTQLIKKTRMKDLSVEKIDFE